MLFLADRSITILSIVFFPVQLSRTVIRWDEHQTRFHSNNYFVPNKISTCLNVSVYLINQPKVTKFSFARITKGNTHHLRRFQIEENTQTKMFPKCSDHLIEKESNVMFPLVDRLTHVDSEHKPVSCPPLISPIHTHTRDEQKTSHHINEAFVQWN